MPCSTTMYYIPCYKSTINGPFSAWACSNTVYWSFWQKLVVKITIRFLRQNFSWQVTFEINLVAANLIWSRDFKIYLAGNGILSPKLFWPTVRKNWPSDREKLLKFEAEGWKFAITRTIYSNSESSEQFLVTECFFKFVPGGVSYFNN